MPRPADSLDWLTKPSDRFVLKWIKCHLSARVTPHLAAVAGIRPWMVTVFSSALGMMAGALFAMGWGGGAGILAGVAQVLDGVDGQLARLTGRQSRGGAFLDSVLDRYADGAMVLGLMVYLIRLPAPIPAWSLLALGFLALAGSGNISYSSARAESLGLDLGSPTLASKGTRTTVMVLSALGSALWPLLPLVALIYLAVHPNVVIVTRILRVWGR